MTRYSLLSILFFLLLFRIPVEAGPIRISSQEEFDRLGERILAELPLKKDVRIQISSGKTTWLFPVSPSRALR